MRDKVLDPPIPRGHLNDRVKGTLVAVILVSGGSGFIGSRIILQLLEAGHQVRTTLRSPARETQLRAMLQIPGNRLSCIIADLESDQGWTAATTGCDHVLHVASPFPATAPADENELIRPAVEGTLRVLRAARDAGVKRVVLTSSFAAIGYGQPPRHTPFAETDWTDLETPLPPYIKSKTMAERAAWDFIAGEGGGLELSVINPVAVLGPVMGDNFATSVLLVKRLLDGDVPGCPRINFGVVDVRDVAALHITAMTHPAAAGERLLAVAGDAMSVLDVAQVLRRHFGAAAKRVPRWQLPDWVVRLAALREPSLRPFVPQLGVVRNASNAKARRLLGWAPRSNQAAAIATAESLLRLGLVKAREGLLF